MKVLGDKLKDGGAVACLFILIGQKQKMMMMGSQKHLLKNFVLWEDCLVNPQK